MLRKLRALWMRVRHARMDEIDQELESHVAMHTADGVRAGLGVDEARRQTLVRLGGAEQTRQAWRERNTLPWLESLLRDVRYALRGFARNPIFAITVIVTLALGIGATTAVFSVDVYKRQRVYMATRRSARSHFLPNCSNAWLRCLEWSRRS